MKKLMFAAAALAAGFAMADGITSANVVGYATTPENTDTMTIIGANWDALGKDFIPLKDLSCPQGMETDDQIQTSYIDDDSVTQLHTYVYDETDGWLDPDDDFAPVGSTVGLATGKSAWFVPNSGYKTITTSGQVYNGNFVHTFTEAMLLCSSAFPVPFCPNSENVSWGVETDDQIQTFYTDDDSVTQLHTYMYDATEGWMDPDDDFRVLGSSEALVNPGQGFWLILNSAESTFTEVTPLK